MSNITLDWLKEKTFVGTDSTGHAIVISTPGAPNGVGVKPSDLLLLGLAACTAVDVVEILTKKRQAPDHLEIRVEGEQDAEPPWAFRKIRVHYILQGAALQIPAVEQAIHLSEGKYCSVAATLRGGSAEITTSYEIHPAPSLAVA
jgi:putative redox protein